MQVEEGYTVKVMEFPNATVRVYRPILTEDEKARRMKLIENAAIDLLMSGGGK